MVHDGAGSPEWWQRLEARRVTWWADHAVLAARWRRVRALALWGGLVWLAVLVVWLPEVRLGLRAWAGLRVGGRRLVLGRHQVAVVVGIHALLRRMSPVVSVRRTSGRALTTEVAELAVRSSGASIAIASITEEALKLVPIAVVVALAPRRAARFATVDWLLLGLASGAAFLAVEEATRRVALSAGTLGRWGELEARTCWRRQRPARMGRLLGVACAERVERRTSDVRGAQRHDRPDGWLRGTRHRVVACRSVDDSRIGRPSGLRGRPPRPGVADVDRRPRRIQRPGRQSCRRDRRGAVLAGPRSHDGACVDTCALVALRTWPRPGRCFDRRRRRRARRGRTRCCSRRPASNILLASAPTVLERVTVRVGDVLRLRGHPGLPFRCASWSRPSWRSHGSRCEISESSAAAHSRVGGEPRRAAMSRGLRYASMQRALRELTYEATTADRSTSGRRLVAATALAGLLITGCRPRSSGRTRGGDAPGPSPGVAQWGAGRRRHLVGRAEPDGADRCRCCRRRSGRPVRRFPWPRSRRVRSSNLRSGTCTGRRHVRPRPGQCDRQLPVLDHAHSSTPRPGRVRVDVRARQLRWSRSRTRDTAGRR